MTAKAKTTIHRMVDRMQLILGAIELGRPIMAAEALRDVRHCCDELEAEIKAFADQLLDKG